MASICSSCGNEIIISSVFCNKCGIKINGTNDDPNDERRKSILKLKNTLERVIQKKKNDEKNKFRNIPPTVAPITNPHINETFTSKWIGCGCLVVIILVIIIAFGSCSTNNKTNNPCREAGFSASDCSKGMKELQKIRN
ncbi:hypothetical protein [Paenibacillus alba]|uniref:Zinc ribbon domain-containing protein n=1 Tax=Paenibacillus alba TaxID=1197127 RepID=A0ABU6G2M8_9BACL|nr:hypothetical protein [Paenibacillus alba]MEC0227924.1 hypothetical protein [Paenibacillus alba]